MAVELPIGDYVSDGVDFMLDNFQGLFDGISAGIEVGSSSCGWDCSSKKRRFCSIVQECGSP